MQRQLHTPHTSSNPTRHRNPVEPAALSIDLSHDPEHNSSSSTVEAFGEPRALWREDSASRIEPVGPTRKKRKSDELDIDELQADDPFRLSQSSFPAIDDVLEDFTPSNKRRSPKQTKSDKLVKKARFSESESDRQPASCQRSNRHFISPNVTERRSRNHESQSQTPRAIENPTSNKKNFVRLQDNDGSDSKAAIADSEDDDDSESFEVDNTTNDPKSERDGPDTFEQTAHKQPALEEDVIKSEEAQYVGIAPSDQKPWLSQQSQEANGAVNASPYQCDSPTKLETEMTQQHFTIPADEGTKKAFNAVDESAVSGFLSYQTMRHQKYLDSLHSDRRLLSGIFGNMVLTGKEITPELNNQVASLKIKITAMEQLLALREEHVQSSCARSAIRKRVREMFDRDLPSVMWEKDAKEGDRLAHRIKHIEREVSLLLPRADLPMDDLPPKHDDQGLPKMKDNMDTSRPETLVQSTPAPAGRIRPAGFTDRGSETKHSQSVQQTQVGQTTTCPSPSRQPLPGSQFGRRSPLRSYADSPSTSDPKAYFMPSPQRSRARPRNGLGEDTTLHSSKAWHKSPPKLTPPIIYTDDGDEGFSKGMENPFDIDMSEDQGFNDDDFGQEDDDVEMVKVTEQTENQGQGQQIRLGDHHRQILAETSGNSMRSDPAKRATTMYSTSASNSQIRHPWSKDVQDALHHCFHLRGFRQNQLEAINATLSGKDVFVLMPTGGGKSLCYQLPSVLSSGQTQGVTVVITPLLSLMQDQIDHLQRLGIQAVHVNGEVSSEYRSTVMRHLRMAEPEKFCQLLYITPEMINKSQAMLNVFRELHQRRKLARIVIDEAHCVSQWGHDFRPDYKQLGEIRQQFWGVPIIALTATATENVKVDVIHNLAMRNYEVFTQSFNRPNLRYEVRTKGKAKDVLDSIAQTIETMYKSKSGIIYCLSKKNCESVATKLREQYNIKAQHYHAGMEAAEKRTVQKGWQDGIHHVMVATIAFGMGIDKPDVRFVIHHTIPKSLEGYYQETGRAGRDGKDSGCFLYYGYQDTSALKRMIEDGEGSWEQKERQRKMLRNMVQFCENRADCRRAQVLNYFNEAFRKESCAGSCDNCSSTSTFETQDLSEYAVAAIELVEAIYKDNVTLLHCVDILRGAKNKKMTDLHHDQLSQFGIGSDLDRGSVERLFYRLISEDALSEFNIINKSGFANQYVQLGRKEHVFRNGRRKVEIQVRLSPSGSKEKIVRKSKTKQRATGVTGARTEFPTSTIVSSPIPAASPRKVNRGRSRPSCDYDDSLEAFIEDDSEYFEEDDMRSPSRLAKGHSLGPPITADQKLASLDEMHQTVVENFVILAKRKCDDIYHRRSLRDRPFTDSSLREMAINFTPTLGEMENIYGVDKEKVRRFGEEFLPLIQDAKRYYKDLRRTGQQEHIAPKSVICISSSESDVGGTDDLDESEDSGGEESSFFQRSAEVVAFNAKLEQSQAKSGCSRVNNVESGSKRKTPARGGYKKGFGGGWPGRGRRKSGGKAQGKGVAKKKSKSARSSEGSSAMHSTLRGERFGIMPT